MRYWKMLVLAFLPGLCGCDEGRIYPEPEDAFSGTGGTVTLTGRLVGSEEWPEGYSVALAGFSEGQDYAEIVKNVTPDSEGNCDTEMGNVPPTVTEVALCVVDRLRRRVATFATQPYSADRPDVRLQADDTDVSMLEAVQNEIFSTTCANCHGGTATAAAGLDLTPGKTLDNTVGVPSVKIPDRLRVAPGDAEESVLYRILTTDESETWHYDHSVEVMDPVRQALVRDWIVNSAFARESRRSGG